MDFQVRRIKRYPVKSTDLEVHRTVMTENSYMAPARSQLCFAASLLLAFSVFPVVPTLGQTPTIDAAHDPLQLAFDSAVKPFLQSYCLDCHGDDEPEAMLDLSVFASSRRCGPRTQDLGHHPGSTRIAGNAPEGFRLRTGIR